MVVISLSVTTSDRQLIQGIPQYITLSANIPCIIFYTLDGTTPTTSSNVYVDSIEMPRDLSIVTLKAFGTNGVDNSAILSVTYKTIIGDARQPQASVTFIEKSHYTQLVGGTLSGIKATYNNTSPMLGVDLSGVPPVWLDGYDAQGNFGVRQEDRTHQFDDSKLSDTNWLGQKGSGIGELVQNDLVYIPADPEESSLTSKRFNPRAMVLFMDSREPSDITIINRPFYWDVNAEKNQMGSFYETYNSEGNKLMSGSFIKQFYNQKDNTMTYYYRDSLTNRWVISVEAMPRLQTSQSNNHLMSVATPKSGDGSGTGFVYRWVLFKRTAII